MSLYKTRIAKGLCGSCGKVEIPSGSLCPGCKEKSRKRAAAKRDKAKQVGKCIGCGKRKPVQGSTRCAKCKEANRQSRAKQIVQFKLNGLCQGCGKLEPKDGCTLCQSCIDKRSEVSSRHYFRRKESGLCRFCNKKPEQNGAALCNYHKELYRDYRMQAKLDAFEAYGGVICAECGSEDADVLEIDHIAGGGGKHRRKLQMEGGGYQFYLWLRRNNYPKGFRVLCPTCNKKTHYDKMALVRTH